MQPSGESEIFSLQGLSCHIQFCPKQHQGCPAFNNFASSWRYDNCINSVYDLIDVSKILHPFVGVGCMVFKLGWFYSLLLGTSDGCLLEAYQLMKLGKQSLVFVCLYTSFNNSISPPFMAYIIESSVLVPNATGTL